MPAKFTFDKQYLNLSDEVVNSILSAIEESRKTGKEIGFYICGNKDKNFPGPKCIGEECKLEIKNCTPSPPIASFHTHPGESLGLPSAGDLISGAEEAAISCIAGAEEIERRTVCCYKPKREITPLLSPLKSVPPKFIDLVERYRRWWKRVKDRYPHILNEEYKELINIRNGLIDFFESECIDLKSGRKSKVLW